MLFYIKFLVSLVLLKLVLFVSPPATQNIVVVPGAMNFEAISDGKKVILSWSIADEKSSDSFIIERSKDGVNFVSALMVNSGKISTLVDYTDIDYSPFSGISYYRLKRTNHAGESIYSETVIVNYQFNREGTIDPFINKVPDAAELKEIENKDVLVVVKNPKGEEFISRLRVTSDNEQLYAIDAQKDLSPGTYQVMASSYNRLYSQKLVIK